MRTRPKARRTEHASALCTDSSVGGSYFSDNTDPPRTMAMSLLIITNLLVVYAGGTQVAFEEKRVPYKINKCHPDHTCK